MALIGYELNVEYSISDKLSIESALDYYPPRNWHLKNWHHINYHLDGLVKLNYFFLKSFKFFSPFTSVGLILRNQIITKDLFGYSTKPSRRPDELEILLGLGIRKEIRKIELFVESNLSHSHKTELRFAGGIKHLIGRRTVQAKPILKN